ncbi:ECF transporter S component, partial [candidate division KSB1 bacterium]|nr:ECF transporter S component [candidate division KSB1 bacterium]
MKSGSRELVLMGLFITLALVIPIFFHLINLGPMFLPMFLPFLLAGFFLRPTAAILVGFISPWLSSLLTGMPPLIPTTPLMSVEGMALSGVVALFYQKWRRSVEISTIAALLAERLILVLAIWVLVPVFRLPRTYFTVMSLTWSLPGIILNLMLVPILVRLLQKINPRHAT